MVQADRGPGKRLRQCSHIADLRMIQPRIERQVQRRQAGKPFSKCLIKHQPGRRRISRIHQARIGVIRCDMPDTPEPPAAGSDVRFQHRAGLLTLAQIDVPHDTGADLRRTITTGRAHRRDAVDEFRLSHRLERLRSRRPMHRPALHEHGADDVVPAIGIRQQVVEHIQPVRPLPQMVVRIDDRQFRLQDRLFAACQPVIPDRQIRAVGRGGAHAGVSLCSPGIVSRRRPNAKTRGYRLVNAPTLTGLVGNRVRNGSTAETGTPRASASTSMPMGPHMRPWHGPMPHRV